MMLDAIILAGGLGTRLRDMVSDVPKPMAPVMGRPFLELQLDSLIKQGFTRAVLSVGYKADAIEAHFGARYGNLELLYCREDFPLGTGGAIRAALPFVTTDGAFIFNGDTYLDLDCQAVLAYWPSKRQGLIVGRAFQGAGRYGRLIVDGDTVTGLTDQGDDIPHAIINAGCYVLPCDVFNGLTLDDPFSFERDFLPRCLPHTPYRLYLMSGLFIDIGVPTDYILAQTLLAPYTTSKPASAHGKPS